MFLQEDKREGVPDQKEEGEPVSTRSTGKKISIIEFKLQQDTVDLGNPLGKPDAQSS